MPDLLPEDFQSGGRYFANDAKERLTVPELRKVVRDVAGEGSTFSTKFAKAVRNKQFVETSFMQQHGVTLANWCMLVAGVEQWMLLEAVGPCTSGDIKASCNALIKIITTMMPHGLHLDFQQLMCSSLTALIRSMRILEQPIPVDLNDLHKLIGSCNEDDLISGLLGAASEPWGFALKRASAELRTGDSQGVGLVSLADCLRWEGLMYDKLKERSGRAEEEPNTAMMLAFHNLIHQTLLLAPLLTPYANLAAGKWRSCLEHLVPHFLDSRCQPKTRFVQLASIASLSQRAALDPAVIWKSILRPRAADGKEVMLSVLEFMPTAMEGLHRQTDDDYVLSSQRVKYILWFLDTAAPAFTLMDKRWAVMLMSCIWKLVDLMREARGRPHLAHFTAQIGEPAEALVTTAHGLWREIHKEYDQMHQSSVEHGRPTHKLDQAALELRFFETMVRQSEGFAPPTDPRLAHLFFMNVMLMLTGFNAEDQRRAQCTNDELMDTGIPGYLIRHAGTSYILVFHTYYHAFTSVYFGLDNLDLFLKVWTRDLTLHQWYARLLLGDLLRDDEVEEGLALFLEQVRFLGDPRTSSKTQRIWREYFISLDELARTCMAFCVAGKLRKVDKALLRDATTEMKAFGKKLETAQGGDARTVQSLCLLNVSKDVTLFLSKLDSIVEGEAADAYVQSLVYPSGKPVHKQSSVGRDFGHEPLKSWPLTTNSAQKYPPPSELQVRGAQSLNHAGERRR